MNLRILFRAMLVAVCLSAATFAHAGLRINLPALEGDSSTVNGIGSHPDGWVELFVNGGSVGSVQADGSGSFSFTGLSLTAGDQLRVKQSRVWNFNDDGDTEGWSAVPSKATLDVTGGNLVITKVGAATLDLVIGPGLQIDPSIFRTWEFRINNPTALTNFAFRYRGTNGFDATNVIGNVGMKSGQAADEFETLHLNPDYLVNNLNQSTYQTQAGGDINALRLDFALSDGEVIKIDYIRVQEYFEYEFANDGDIEYLRTNAAMSSVTVENDALNFTLSALNPNISKAGAPPDKTRIDPSYFTHIYVGGSQTSAIGDPVDQYTFYFNPAGLGLAGNNRPISPLPMDGTRFDASTDITVDPDYQASPPTTEFRLDPGTFDEAVGDTGSIDYIRLGPADPYGPSPVAVVTEPRRLEIVLPVVAGSPTTVTGRGSAAGGWVELLVNGQSRGSVQADAQGLFAFSNVSIAAGDRVSVTQSRVWNFNEDGNTEGWLVANGAGTVQATGGSLVVTKTDPANIDLRTSAGLALDPSIYRVWEFRINNPTTMTAFNLRYRGTNDFSSTNVLGNIGIEAETGAEYITYHVNPDYLFDNSRSSYQEQVGGLINQIRLDVNPNVGEGVSFDYIRVTEYFDYDFADDGDVEQLTFNNLGTPSVAGGALDYTLAAPNPSIQKLSRATDRTRIDPFYFTNIEVGGAQVEANAPAGTDQFTFFFDPGGLGLAGNIVQITPLPVDGTPFVGNRDITRVETWQDSPPALAWRLDPGTFFEDTGDTGTLDYIRLLPPDPYGPSAEVVATASRELVLSAPEGAGPAVPVEGSGSPADGWVELWINGVSYGSVRADSSGDFVFNDVALNEGDQLRVTQSLVWNFNQDGDAEGWFISNGTGTLDVTGGALEITRTTDTGAIDLRSPSLLGLDPSVYRVWELRMNNPTTRTAFNFRYRGVNDFATTNVLGFVGMKSSMGTDFETLRLNPDYLFNDTRSSYQIQEGGVIQQIRLDFEQPLGETIRFDAIRATEYWDYDFSDDGDFEYLNLGAAVTSPTVSGGSLSFTLGAPNPSIFRNATGVDKSRLDPTWFIKVAVGGTQIDQDAGNPTDQYTLFFDSGAGFPGNNVPLRAVPTDGTRFDRVEDLTVDPDFLGAGGPIFGWRLDTGTFFEDSGDVVALDYWRLQPADPFGPSNDVTVGPMPTAARMFELYR